MFNRNVLTLFLAVIISAATFCKAEAADYYLGEYANGTVAYLDTTSIRVTNHYTNGYHDGDTCTCTVKAVNPNSGNFDRISYEVYCGQNASIIKEGVRLFRSLREAASFWKNNPVESNLTHYCYDYIDKKSRKVPERIY